MATNEKTILVVEDDEAVRRMLSMALRLAGFAAIEAQDGFEAITLLGSRAVEAVVLDLTLPGLDGGSVRREIAANPRTRRLPVIIMTGSQEPLIDVHPACVLRKPVAPEHVVATVTMCLRQARDLGEP
jgi:DNA-binding response OmpR family regulator